MNVSLKRSLNASNGDSTTVTLTVRAIRSSSTRGASHQPPVMPMAIAIEDLNSAWRRSSRCCMNGIGSGAFA